MSTDRTRSQCTITDLFHVASLPKVQHERHYFVAGDLEPMAPGPGHVAVSRVREKDPRLHGFESPSSHLTSAFARRTSGAMARIVSSPAIVPMISGRRAPSS